MERTEQKNKVKNILYAKRSWDSHPEVLSEQIQGSYRANLLKYFPKYLESIQFQRFDTKTLAKLKRTKIIHKVQAIEPTNKMILQSRIFLANKTKTVQKYDNLTNPKQIIQKLRRFPSLQTISFSSVSKPGRASRATGMSRTPEALKKEMDDLHKISKYIKGLSQLQSLNIIFDKKEFIRALRVLDSSRNLRHLKHLAIVFKWKNSTDQTVLKDLIFEAKNLFHYVTYLNLGELSHDGFEAFKELPGKCPNLQRMSLKVDNRDYFDHFGLKSSCSPQQVSSDYLLSFEAFQRLERISLRVADEETFFRDLILPISTKYVEIWFCPILNSFSFGADPTICSLKEDVKSADFYERWSRLKNIESLNILDSDIGFAQELLKSIPQLRVLELGRVKLLPGVGSFDIANFFGPLEHISKGLEVLELESASFRLKEESAKEIIFPKLERLKVKGKWDKNEFKNYLRLFKNNRTSRENCMIEFGGSFYSQSEELFQLLEQLHSVYRAEDGLEMSFHIQIKLSFNNEWKDAFIKQFEEFTERGKVMKNVSLDLRSPVSLAGLFYGKLDKFEAFGKLLKKFEY